MTVRGENPWPPTGRNQWPLTFNHDRLHGHCEDVPPAEFEAAFYAAQQTDQTKVGNQ